MSALDTTKRCITAQVLIMLMWHISQNSRDTVDLDRRHASYDILFSTLMIIKYFILLACWLTKKVSNVKVTTSLRDLIWSTRFNIILKYIWFYLWFRYSNLHFIDNFIVKIALEVRAYTTTLVSNFSHFISTCTNLLVPTCKSMSMLSY